MNYQMEMTINGQQHTTLADILPRHGPMKMLIVAKTPAPISVEKGHYFQGKQGQMFWNRLREYGVLSAPSGKQSDEMLLEHGFGITDIVKVPRGYGNEPSDDEYRDGLPRILKLVDDLRPQILMFVYKRVLDNTLRIGFEDYGKTTYGFNPQLNERFRAQVFVFPMPGTPCTRAQAAVAMGHLVNVLGSVT